MNKGIATAQRSLEITLVRAQMDAQAETIRYIHQAYVAAYQQGGPAPTGVGAQWIKMTSKAAGNKGADNASVFGATNGTSCPAQAPGDDPFILNARTATVWGSVPTMATPAGSTLPPYSQVRYNPDSSINRAYGIWVEAVPSRVDANGTGFVDFHIRSCWSSPGSARPVTLGTIVRLYEPR
jgi:hypothetical protein